MIFYFDFISHNAFLAWYALCEQGRDRGFCFEPVPVLFAGLLNHYGMRGPAEIPAKNRWMLRNVMRKASALGLELRPPASHPFNPLLALRCCHAVEGEERMAIVDALFRATWCDAKDIADPAVVAETIDQAGGDGAAIVSRAGRFAAKTALRDATDAAIERGVFGVPTLAIENELFWGYDDLPWALACLDDADPLDGVDLSAWESVQPSASRL